MSLLIWVVFIIAATLLSAFSITIDGNVSKANEWKDAVITGVVEPPDGYRNIAYAEVLVITDNARNMFNVAITVVEFNSIGSNSSVLMRVNGKDALFMDAHGVNKIIYPGFKINAAASRQYDEYSMEVSVEMSKIGKDDWFSIVLFDKNDRNTDEFFFNIQSRTLLSGDPSVPTTKATTTKATTAAKTTKATTSKSAKSTTAKTKKPTTKKYTTKKYTKKGASAKKYTTKKYTVNKSPTKGAGEVLNVENGDNNEIYDELFDDGGAVSQSGSQTLKKAGIAAIALLLIIAAVGIPVYQKNKESSSDENE
jgi:hypothetical protein